MTSKLSGKKILVTGAAGFIGSHLTKELVEQGASVTALVMYNARSDIENLAFLPQETLKEINITFGNIEDPFFVDQLCAGQDYIFHLAALIGIPYSYVAPASYVRTNIEGTVNILEAVKKHQTARLLHTSTSEVYGTADYSPIDESHPLKGQSPYAASKIGADKMAESYFRSFETPVVTVRPFNTYGPHQSARAVIPTIISQALKGSSVKLGALSPQRDMTYVSDTVKGFIAAAIAESIEGETINLGVGKTATIGEIADMIFNIMGKDIEIISDESRMRPEKSEVLRLVSDNEKAKNKMGWKPEISLRQGLQQTIQHIENNINCYNTDTYII